MSARPVLASAAALVVLSLAAGAATGTEESRQSSGAQSRVDVRIDLAATRQVIQGFGTSNRVWNDPHLANLPAVSVPAAAQARILTLLYRRLGLTRVRTIVDGGVQKSPRGPFDFSWKLGEAHIAFIKQARPFGVKTYFPSPLVLEDWMRPENPGAYVDWAIEMLKYWRSRGLELALFSPLNEPQLIGNYPPQWLHDVVVQLGARMRAAGLKTKLVIPDDVNPADAYRRAVAVLEDPKARRYVGALAYHTYSSDLSAVVPLRQLGRRYSLPVWMTEWNNQSGGDWSRAMAWAERVHYLLTVGGVNAIDYMWGYFGDYDGAQLISLDFSGGTYRGFSETPAYWLTGQYSRHIRPGFVRVAVTTSSDAVLTTAFRGPKRAIIVATNRTALAQGVRVTVRGGVLKGPLRPVRSSIGERWRSLPSIASRGGAFTTTLPPLSVTTFVAIR